MQSRVSQIITSPNSLVRIDRIPIEEAVITDWRVKLAMTAWQNDPYDRAAERFLANMRRTLSPDPAHLTDTSANDLPNWKIENFKPHPFVMDGAEHTNTAVGAIRERPVRIAAEETYSAVVHDAQPACFIVTMPARVYQRAMFPFFGNLRPSPFDNGRIRLVPPLKVTKVVTVIKPIVVRATLAEVIASQTPLRDFEFG